VLRRTINVTGQVRGDLVDRPLEDGHGRPQELVDRGADDDDELARPADHLAAAAKLEPTGRQELTQQVLRAGLEERHLAVPDPLERRRVRVVDADPQAGPREGEAEGQPNVAAAAEHDEIEVLAHGADLTRAVQRDTAGRRSHRCRYAWRGECNAQGRNGGAPAAAGRPEKAS
jgi:hypothetical protein